MQDLYDATKENVYLAVLNGIKTLYAERLSGRSSVAVLSGIGTRLHLHATGVGKVPLAHAPAGTATVGRLIKITSRTVTNDRALQSQLALVRQRRMPRRPER